MRDNIQDKRLFIFDAGGVTIKNIDFSKELCSTYGIDYTEFWDDYSKYEFPMFEGVVTEEMYLKHLERKFNIKITGNPIKEYFRPTINEEMRDIIKRLKDRGYRVVLGSNTIADHTDVMTKMGALDLFDELYCSDRMGLSKPGRFFFEYILEHEGVKAEDAFFTDDRLDYIEGAIQVGIDTLHYNGDDRSAKLRDTFSFLYN